MSSYRRVWLLCAIACALVSGVFCMQAIDAVDAVGQTVEKTGQARLIGIASTKSSSRNPTRHTANLRFKSTDIEAVLYEFPNQPYQSTDHKELMNDVLALTQQTNVSANCSNTSRTCYVYAGVATRTKVALLISLFGLAMFVLLAYSATTRKAS